MPTVLVKVTIAVKRHHDQGNSYKEKRLTRVSLQFRALVHYHDGECAGRHGAGEGAEGSAS